MKYLIFSVIFLIVLLVSENWRNNTLVRNTIYSELSKVENFTSKDAVDIDTFWDATHGQVVVSDEVFTVTVVPERTVGPFAFFNTVDTLEVFSATDEIIDLN